MDHSPSALPVGQGQITAQPVPHHRRLSILPRYFQRHLSAGEASVYIWMCRLCPGYQGGYWDFIEILEQGRGVGFFMYPTDQQQWEMCCDNGFNSAVTAELAGLVACVYAVNHLWHRDPDAEHLEALYDALRAYARTRSDYSLFLAAID